MQSLPTEPQVPFATFGPPMQVLMCGQSLGARASPAPETLLPEQMLQASSTTSKRLPQLESFAEMCPGHKRTPLVSQGLPGLLALARAPAVMWPQTLWTHQLETTMGQKAGSVLIYRKEPSRKILQVRLKELNS